MIYHHLEPFLRHNLCPSYSCRNCEFSVSSSILSLHSIGWYGFLIANANSSVHLPSYDIGKVPVRPDKSFYFMNNTHVKQLTGLSYRNHVKCLMHEKIQYCIDIDKHWNINVFESRTCTTVCSCRCSIEQAHFKI